MSPKAKRLVYPLLAFGGAFVLIAILVATKKTPERKPEERLIPSVQVESVELGPLQLSLNSQGLVEAKYSTDLITQVSGEIVEVSPSFERGGLIKQGELLLQVDPFDYEVRVEEARANLASARAAFILERAQGQVAEAEWEKISNAKPSDLGLRKPQQEQALANVKAAEAGLKRALKDLERTRIEAHADVLVADRSVSVGTFVNVGTRVGKVMDISAAQVRLPIAGSDLKFLEGRGEGAWVKLSAMSDGVENTWNAQLVRDEGLVNAESRMLYLVAEITDPYLLNESPSHTQRLPFGTYVTAEIGGKHFQSAASVSRHLVRDGKIAVFADGKLELKPVELIRHDGKRSIVAGLDGAEQLITSALAHVVDGMELQLLDQTTQQEPEELASPAPEVAQVDDEEA